MQDHSAPQLGARFMLDAEADPGLLPRVLEPFAKRALLPDRMWAHSGAEIVHIEVAVRAADADTLHRIEGNLRQLVGLRRLVVLHTGSLAQVA